MLSLSRLKDKLFYGWVIVAALFVVGTALWGIRLSFGVFFKSIEGEFQITRAATSSVFSTYMAIGCIFVILGGWALDKYGPRIILLLMALFTGLGMILTSQTNSPWQLYITYGLLLAAGSSTTYVLIMSTVSRWFDKKRGLALGISGLGTGLGPLIMAPSATYLISTFNWRITFIVIGLIIWLVVIPLTRLLKRDPYEIGLLPDGAASPSKDTESKTGSTRTTGLSIFQVLRTSSFWFIMVLWLLYAFTIFLVLTHLVPHATDIGISAEEAALVFGLIGITNMAGKLGMGIVSDRIGRKVASVICSLLQAGAMVWLIWAQDLWAFYLFALVYGFGYGGLATTVTALIGESFGLSKIGSIFGLLEVGFSIGAAVGPIIGGLIFDISKSYAMAFILGAAAMLIVTLLVIPIRRETENNYS